MKVLVFDHHGRKVAASSWTASENGGITEIVYLRPGAVGSARIALRVPLTAFLKTVAAAGNIVEIDRLGEVTA